MPTPGQVYCDTAASGPSSVMEAWLTSLGWRPTGQHAIPQGSPVVGFLVEDATLVADQPAWVAVVRAEVEVPRPEGTMEPPQTVKDALVGRFAALTRVVTPRQFMDRLPLARQGMITAAALQSPELLLWLIRLTGATEVNLDLPETQQGVASLQAAGAITPAEAAALLA